MNTQQSRTTLALVVAMSLAGPAAMAAAQPAAPPTPPSPPVQSMPPNTPPPPPAPQNMPPAPSNASSQLYPGTVSQASFPLPDSNGGSVTVRAGMPGQAQQYGPPPAFKSLDTNGDGRIDHAEARAYPPLDSDFLFASHEGSTISRAQYEHWVRTQH